MRRLIFAAALAASAALPVHAAVVSGSYSATILYSTDVGNYFGGGSLLGQSITVGYSYDPAGLTYNSFSGGDNLVTTAGTGFVTALVTINGITKSASNDGNTHTAEIVAQASGSKENVNFFPDVSGGNSVGFTLETVGPAGAGFVTGAILGANPFGDLATYSLTAGGYTQTVYVQFGGGPTDSITFYQTTADQAANGGQGSFPDSGGADVPEPASVLLVSAGLAMFGWARLRRA
jgi:hypothetical protein